MAEEIKVMERFRDEELNFPSVLFWQLNRINEAIAKQDLPTTQTTIDTLECQLAGHMDDEYHEEIKKVVKEFNNKKRKINPHIGGIEKLNNLLYQYLLKKYKLLIKLMHRAKLIPTAAITIEV